MARLRYNGLTATLGAALASGDTTITFTAALASAAGVVPTIAGTDIIPLTILDSAGNVAEIVSLTAYTSGATTGTIARAQESTTATAHASGAQVVHAPTVADIGTSSSLLASHSYNPATGGSYVLTGTEADADSANLAVTFTAPTSGTVIVSCSIIATATPPAGSGSTVVNFSFRNGASTVADSGGRIFLIAADDKPIQARVLHEARVTGLTSGTTYTFKLGAWNGGTGSATVQYGGTGANPVGPAVFKVLAA